MGHLRREVIASQEIVDAMFFQASIRYLCPFHTRIVATIPNVGLLGTPIFLVLAVYFVARTFLNRSP